MTSIQSNLDTISARYCVFEENQVLTHVQLNDLADYLDDQDRLTRVGLLGVGILCGLRAFIINNRVVLTRGVAVTTDGDLLRETADATFDRFKPYDASSPVYGPFLTGDKMIPVFELVKAKADDAQAVGLAEFSNVTNRALRDMVGLLFMESYVKDNDICTGAGCDNLGKDALHTPKLLLLDKKSVSELKGNFVTLDSAARRLEAVVANRAVIAATIDSPSDLVGAYQTACNSIRESLQKVLPTLYPTCSAFLADLFKSDPAQAWLQSLKAANDSLPSDNVSIQYYYDFLKDVAETYNAFRDRLFGDVSVCCPDILAFRKHVVLGALSGETDEDRTGFYPSPIVRVASDALDHARFLARTLDAMIGAFSVPSGPNQPIRVTPSLFEDRSLEDRAIPFYYKASESLPIHKAWSYTLTRRGLERNNYSYNAKSYGATGAAADPLAFQVGPFPFFRVEGHIGQSVTSAVKSLDKEIKDKNLPFAVRTIMLGTDKGKLERPPIRYTDLHRFHYLLRHGVAHQLDEVLDFSERFKGLVDSKFDSGVVKESERDDARTQNKAVRDSATPAKNKLGRKYANYDSTWREDLQKTLTAAGEFKYKLSSVVKTEFVTPFDSAIGSTQAVWLDWLDKIIKDKDEQADDGLLLSNFLRQYPGAEHFAGVVRGGTFVLVYDSTKTVVADLMLPYSWCDAVEEPPLEQPPPKPAVRPNLSDVFNGIKIIPSLDDEFKNRLDRFNKNDVEPAWRREVETQRRYFEVFKDSVNILSSAAGASPKGGGSVIDIGKPGDSKLDSHVREIATRVDKIDRLRKQVLRPDLDPAKRDAINNEIGSAEGELSRSLQTTTQYVATNKLELKEGSDGLEAMAAVSRGFDRIKGQRAVDSVKNAMETANTTGGDDFKSVVKNILSNRGLG